MPNTLHFTTLFIDHNGPHFCTTGSLPTWADQVALRNEILTAMLGVYTCALLLHLLLQYLSSPFATRSRPRELVFCAAAAFAVLAARELVYATFEPLREMARNMNAVAPSVGRGIGIPVVGVGVSCWSRMRMRRRGWGGAREWVVGARWVLWVAVLAYTVYVARVVPVWRQEVPVPAELQGLPEEILGARRCDDPWWDTEESGLHWKNGKMLD